MSIELGAMAESADFRLLRYLLDMVRLESETLLRDGRHGLRQTRPVEDDAASSIPGST